VYDVAAVAELVGGEDLHLHHQPAPPRQMSVRLQ
jgi:hypothetical protein